MHLWEVGSSLTPLAGFKAEDFSDPQTHLCSQRQLKPGGFAVKGPRKSSSGFPSGAEVCQGEGTAVEVGVAEAGRAG